MSAWEQETWRCSLWFSSMIRRQINSGDLSTSTSFCSRPPAVKLPLRSRIPKNDLLGEVHRSWSWCRQKKMQLPCNHLLNSRNLSTNFLSSQVRTWAPSQITWCCYRQRFQNGLIYRIRCVYHSRWWSTRWRVVIRLEQLDWRDLSDGFIRQPKWIRWLEGCSGANRSCLEWNSMSRMQFWLRWKQIFLSLVLQGINGSRHGRPSRESGLPSSMNESS